VTIPVAEKAQPRRIAIDLSDDQAGELASGESAGELASAPDSQ